MHKHYIINNIVEFHPAASTLRDINNPDRVVVLNSPAGRCLLLLIDRAGSIIAHSGTDITVEVDPAKLRPVEVPVIRADISKLQADTGWQPEIPLEQTIAETLDDWKNKLK